MRAERERSNPLSTHLCTPVRRCHKPGSEKGTGVAMDGPSSVEVTRRIVQMFISLRIQSRK